MGQAVSGGAGRSIPSNVRPQAFCMGQQFVDRFAAKASWDDPPRRLPQRRFFLVWPHRTEDERADQKCLRADRFEIEAPANSHDRLAHDIGGDIGKRIFEAVTNAGLRRGWTCRQCRCPQIQHRLLVGDIGFLEREILARDKLR